MTNVYQARRWFSSVVSGVRPTSEVKIFLDKDEADKFAKDNSETIHPDGYFHWEITKMSLISNGLYKELQKAVSESFDDFDSFCWFKLGENVQKSDFMETLEEEFNE